ncbi:MAG: hypothetical protein CSA33_02160 [Desulfobulbus propionicus]|nr:MAG: hypothetical protein CSA33_02160 [Desulfobulbus propionicus]
MAIFPYENKKNTVLQMEDLHDQLLALVLDRLRLGHESSLSLSLASSRHGEGVSTILFNLAAALSKGTTKRILLVDGNSRRPVLHSWFGIPLNKPGFFDVLAGEAPLETALVLDDYNNYAVLTRGQQVQHPIVLIDSIAFRSFLEQVKQQFDVILFDCPPLQNGPETSVLARQTDAFILIVEAEKTRWEVAEHHKKQLAANGVPLSGAILNKKKMFIPRLIYRLLLAN